MTFGGNALNNTRRADGASYTPFFVAARNRQAPATEVGWAINGRENVPRQSSICPILYVGLMARALTINEQQALAAMLAIDFPGAKELRAQAPTARVVRQCDCGCATIDLIVDPKLPVAPISTLVPVEAPTKDGGLLLFVTDGRLSGLEIYSSHNRAPAAFPAKKIKAVERPG